MKKINFDELKKMNNKQLIELFRKKFPIPRPTGRFKNAKHQIEQGEEPYEKEPYDIIREEIEIERIHHSICKYCLIQLLKKGEDTYRIRFAYYYLTYDCRFPFGSQTTLIIPIPIAKSLIEKFFKCSLDGTFP